MIDTANILNQNGVILLSGSVINGATDVTLNGGSVEGFGTINSTVVNTAGSCLISTLNLPIGTIRPGGVSTIGNITFQRYSQQSAGRLEIEITNSNLLPLFCFLFSSRLWLGKRCASGHYKRFIKWSHHWKFPWIG